jgi:hypothetical protein
MKIFDMTQCPLPQHHCQSLDHAAKYACAADIDIAQWTTWFRDILRQEHAFPLEQSNHPF